MNGNHTGIVYTFNFKGGNWRTFHENERKPTDAVSAYAVRKRENYLSKYEPCVSSNAISRAFVKIKRRETTHACFPFPRELSPLPRADHCRGLYLLQRGKEKDNSGNFFGVKHGACTWIWPKDRSAICFWRRPRGSELDLWSSACTGAEVRFPIPAFKLMAMVRDNAAVSLFW